MGYFFIPTSGHTEWDKHDEKTTLIIVFSNLGQRYNAPFNAYKNFWRKSEFSQFLLLMLPNAQKFKKLFFKQTYDLPKTVGRSICKKICFLLFHSKGKLSYFDHWRKSIFLKNELSSNRFKFKILILNDANVYWWRSTLDFRITGLSRGLKPRGRGFKSSRAVV